MDVLEGIVLEDDKQIQIAEVRKVYDKEFTGIKMKLFEL